MISNANSRLLLRTNSSGSLEAALKKTEQSLRSLEQPPRKIVEQLWNDGLNKTGFGPAGSEAAHNGRAKKLLKKLEQKSRTREYAPASQSATPEAPLYNNLLSLADPQFTGSFYNGQNTPAPELNGWGYPQQAYEVEQSPRSPYATATPRAAEQYASLTGASVYQDSDLHTLFTPRTAAELNRNGQVALHPFNPNAVQQMNAESNPFPMLPPSSVIGFSGQSSSSGVGYALGRSLSSENAVQSQNERPPRLLRGSGVYRPRAY